MKPTSIASVESHFASLEDPRSGPAQRHHFIDILVIAICADTPSAETSGLRAGSIICGADGWVAVEAFGKAKYNWLSTFLQLPHGIPSHDTFTRVFRTLNPQQFERCFFDWIRAVSQLTEGEIIPIDGKQLRRSHDSEDGKAAIHLVSAWSSAQGLALAQVKVDDKSNEIVAIPQLLEVLDIKGCIVTIDAMGCQTEIAAKIVEQESDYLLALKKNQGHLYADVQFLFDDLIKNPAADAYDDCDLDSAQTVEKDHGPIETRDAFSLSGADCIASLRNANGFANLKTVVKVTAERDINDEVSVESRYYISSLSSNACQLLHATRTHWGIENCVHWVLDIAFREDECRIRKGNGAQNFAILRRIALNLLKQDDSVKLGIANKRLLSAWDNEYLMKILSTLFY